MYRIDGKRVSRSWWIVLRVAELEGVPYQLNSGRRTMGEQRALRAAYERFLRGGPWAPLAAQPDPRAPHIDEGNESHALDIRWDDGGVYRVAAFLRRHGAHPRWTVPGEKWHIEITEAELRMLVRKLAPKLDKLYLTNYERKQVGILLDQRRIAKRNGGWNKVDPSHLRKAVKAKKWLKSRAKYLSKNKSNKFRRRERLRYIRSVI